MDERDGLMLDVCWMVSEDIQIRWVDGFLTNVGHIYKGMDGWTDGY